MTGFDISIRAENAADAAELHALEALVRDAFWDEYAPGAVEHAVLAGLRRSAAFVPKLSLVAVRTSCGAVIGSIAFSRSEIQLDAGGSLPVLTLGPVAVAPDRRGHGIGSRLVTAGLTEARRLGFRAVLLTGDPAWYVRFGFRRARAFGIRLPDGSSPPGLQALELSPGALASAAGVWRFDPAFEPSAEAVAEEEAKFPPRTKHAGTASQRRFAEMLARWEGEEVEEAKEAERLEEAARPSA